MILLTVGCSPPPHGRAERIEFKPVTLDLDELRINRKATMSHVDVDAAFVDAPSLSRMFGRTGDSLMPRDGSSTESPRELDVYFLSVVRVDPAFGKHLLFFSAEFVEPEALRGRQIVFSGGPVHLARGEEEYSVVRVSGPTLPLRFLSREDSRMLFKQLQSSDIKLRVVNVNAK